jgi:KDO2-lipid IV(A) lauroyltransferase
LKKKKKKPQKPIQWRLEYLAHWMVENSIAWLPGPWVFRIGEFLGELTWRFMGQRRKMVSRNLRIAFGDQKTAKEIEVMVRANFRRTGANMVSAAHTARLSPEKLVRNIRVENLHLMEQAHADGKGVVLLLAHMGNWEALSRLVHFFPKGLKIGGFYRPLNNPLLDEKILERRQADGSRMFSKKDPFHQATGFLREGGMVGILADQRVGIQGDLVTFFGRLTRASPLPSLLARRVKSKVIALSLVTEAPGKWIIKLHEVTQPYSTKHCMEALEQAMQMSPLDVFWMQERWKIFARRSRPIQEWLGTDSRQGAKPHRALIWLAGAPTSWQVPENWQHPDVVYEVILFAEEVAPSWLPQATQIHRIQALQNPSSLRKCIAALDTATIFPIAYILAPKGSTVLSEEARKENIPLISLP